MHLVFQGFDTTARQFYVRIQKERVASSNLQAALFERPKLAAPAVGQRRAFDDSKIGIGKLARHGRGAVIGSIVDQNNLEIRPLYGDARDRLECAHAQLARIRSD